VTNGAAWTVVRKEKLADGTIIFSDSSDIPPAFAPRSAYTRVAGSTNEAPLVHPPAAEPAPAVGLAMLPPATNLARPYGAWPVGAVGVIVGCGLAAVGMAVGMKNSDADVVRPTLAPDDAGFVDTRHGWGWGDRCWNHLREGKYGWARAECDKGLAMAGGSPSPRPSLLYNIGLIEQATGNLDAARRYFQQSLTLREHPEVRAALNALPAAR
jgi:hypothetical protein